MHVTEMGLEKGLQMVLSYSLQKRINEEATQLRKLTFMVELPKVNDDDRLSIKKEANKK
jgi:hypothetical protein